jgi:hypothetical protein
MLEIHIEMVYGWFLGEGIGVQGMPSSLYADAFIRLDVDRPAHCIPLFRF